jgi:hypothetical protein
MSGFDDLPSDRALNNDSETKCPVKNLGLNERLLRAFVAEIFILTAFFWRGDEWQLLLYLVAAMFIIQAASGTCGVYSLLKWDTCGNIKRKSDKRLLYGALAAMTIIAVAGSYGSAVITRDIFIEDLSSVEEPYNATLNSAAQGLAPETEDEYGQLTASFSTFQNKYARYQPLAVKFDDQFEGDMQNLSIIISGSGRNIAAGNLTRAEADLKSAEPIFAGIKERNGLS